MAENIKIIIDAKDQASRVIGGIGKSFASLGKIAGVGLGAAVAGIGALGAGVISLAKDAEPLVGVRDAFNALTADMEGGTAGMLASLQEASSGMATNTDMMESMNKAAMLVSKDFAESLPDAMGYLGKVSAATGQDMGFMMDSLVTGIGRLSPMILDNLGIQVSLTEANEAYAESIGKSADELTKSEQQTALMNQVMEKLAINTEGMASPAGGFASMGVMFQNLREEVGMKLVPALAPLLEGLFSLAQNILPKVIETVDTVLPIIQGLGEAFNILRWAITGDELMDWNEAGQMAPEWMRDVTYQLADMYFKIKEEVIPAIVDFGQKVMKFLEPVTTWIQENITLKDVLIALAVVIGGAVLSAIISVMSPLVPLILLFGALVLAVVLVRKVWEEDFLGIRTILEDFWRNTAQPIFETLRAWLAENIPKAIEILRTFWEEKLLPAIQRVWEFLTVDLMPVWEALKELLGVAIPLVLTALQGLWENVLLPALEDVWAFIQDNIIPIFEGWSKSVGGVQGAIEKVVGWITTLTTKLGSIELPSWLVGDSPSPFEVTLQGVRREMEMLSSYSLPSFGAGLNALGRASSVSNMTTVNNTWNVQTSMFNAPSEQRAAMQFATGGI